MKTLVTKAALKSWRRSLGPRETVGFVPTMGALHEGHLSLVQLAREKCNWVVVSIFVNPLQFGPQEDFAKYPRPFEEDEALLRAARVDALFAPEPEDLLFQDSSTLVSESRVSKPLCGAFRPGHFDGVATIVTKLFNLVQPTTAFFGQKDAQQCAVVERFVRDLDIPVEIVRGPIVREADGLAMSSRNRYLKPQAREKAPRIFQSLKVAEEAFQKGERSTDVLCALGRGYLEKDPGFQVQYWEARDPQTLEPISEVTSRGALLAVATYLDGTRLIDNLVL